MFTQKSNFSLLTSTSTVALNALSSDNYCKLFSNINMLSQATILCSNIT